MHLRGTLLRLCCHEVEHVWRGAGEKLSFRKHVFLKPVNFSRTVSAVRAVQDRRLLKQHMLCLSPTEYKRTISYALSLYSCSYIRQACRYAPIVRNYCSRVGPISMRQIQSPINNYCTGYNRNRPTNF